MTVTPPAKILASRSTVAEVGHQAVSRPGPAHLLRAIERFNLRLGNQSAAAMTYFLVLSMIPISMFTFAGLGFVLDVLRPDLIPVITDALDDVVPGSTTLTDTFERFLNDWQTVGLVGIVAGLYSGQGFIGNLKTAVRSLLRDDHDAVVKEPFVKKILSNVGILVTLLIGVLFTVALTVAGTGLPSTIIGFFDLPSWTGIFIVIVPLIISFAAVWQIFMFLFLTLPEQPVGRRAKIRGSLIGAIATVVLLQLATVLIDLFSGNPTAVLFGPIIATVLALNVFARVVLFVAAWVGTAVEPLPREDTTQGFRLVEDRVQAQSLGALITATGLIALTILGFNRISTNRADQNRTMK